jgi:hypothetical protein
MPQPPKLSVADGTPGSARPHDDSRRRARLPVARSEATRIGEIAALPSMVGYLISNPSGEGRVHISFGAIAAHALLADRSR